MTIHFQIEYFTNWGQELFLCLHYQNGDMACLEMEYDGHGIWHTEHTFPDEEIQGEDVYYSYMVRNGDVIERQESGSHHIIPFTSASRLVLSDRWKNAGDNEIDQRTVAIPHVRLNHRPLWKGAGTAIPVFSLRSSLSFGIGEFADLKPLADWARKCGMTIIQTLPVNDTIMTKTWRDSYPYSANSSFALNPMYLRLQDVGILSDKEFLDRMEKTRQELNSLPEVDFEKVMQVKTEYIDRLFEEFSNKCFATKQFKQFFAENRSWLEPYAIYCYLRDLYGTPDFNQWPENERHFSNILLNKYCVPGNQRYRHILKQYFIQYHLHIQFLEVRKYMNDMGILLKGDIPIGVNRFSSDAWIYPQLFNMDCQAGAPPDDFAVDGQRWGMPTYNWDAMKADDYQWFIRRFRKMADYFNAYRIDHLLGFFRIWEIPLKYKSGLMGRFNPAMTLSDAEIDGMGFYQNPRDFSVAPEGTPETNVLFLEDTHRPGTWHPRINAFDTPVFKSLNRYDQEAFRRIHDYFYYCRNNSFWEQSAMDKLPVLINATNMIVCGEDLGMIPQCVPTVMEHLRIMSLEIQRMPKQEGIAIANPASYPYMSVCTTSTHDMSVLRSWILDEMPADCGMTDRSASPRQCEDIIGAHLASMSMLAIFPLQDWLAIDGSLRAPDPAAERINVPANPDNYWRYRMHIGLEQLNEERHLIGVIRSMILNSGR